MCVIFFGIPTKKRTKASGEFTDRRTAVLSRLASNAAKFIKIFYEIRKETRTITNRKNVLCERQNVQSMAQ